MGDGMDSAIFLKWFEEQFIPNVKTFHKQTSKSWKVLLIIDKAPTHPPIEVLNEIDKNFEVQFLSPNVTATLQPIDQGVIEKMKRSYRKQLLRRLLLAEKEEESVTQFIFKVNLKDCIYMLVDAWETLTETNLKRAWRKLWPYNEGKDNNQEEDGDIDGAVNEITDICSKLTRFEECDKDDAMEWLAVDGNDPGYQLLTDEEITDMLLNEEDEDRETMGSDGDEAENKAQETGPTHSEAFVAAETLITWLEKQNESSPTQLMLLKRIKDLAAKKRTTTAVQKPITDFFNSNM